MSVRALQETTAFSDRAISTFPWIANVLSTVQIGKGIGASARYGFATGRPYTPCNMVTSVQQNRTIYDLGHLNTPRALSYSRLDVQMNKDFALRGRYFQIYAGVDNVTNRKNFLTYTWLPLAPVHHGSDKNPVRELFQKPIFPNFGVRFVVR